jgi:oligoendopeptidase F
MKKLKNTMLAICIILVCHPGFSQELYKSRQEIPQQYKWNLKDIYESWNDWETGFKQAEEKIDLINSFKGKLGEGPDNLLAVLKLSDDLGIIISRVYEYPKFLTDLDGQDQLAKAKLQQVLILLTKYNTSTAWINPEVLEIPWETIEKWINTNEFAPYRFGISNLFRTSKHVFDTEKETLISFYSRFSTTPSEIYSELSTTDINFPVVTLSDGSQVKATNGNYLKTTSTSKNQSDREKMFRAHYETFRSNKNTYAAIYNSVCQSDWANALSRNYKSCLESSLDGNNIPTSIYENLIKTVRENTGPLQRYHILRKKILRLKHYYLYDQSIAITDYSEKYPFEKAKDLVLKSVTPMGEKYAATVAKALNSQWIDVFESDGKESGAYSASVYGVHPYMLMNYNQTLRSVFTLAHEMGHTMHSVLSTENQPYSTSGYTLYVAEVASTFNEALLLDYILKSTQSPEARIAVLQQSIENIASTFYLQVLFADFEQQVHALVEKGEPVTADVLSDIIKQLDTVYYGDSIEQTDLSSYVWTRISHFFIYPFYVYQYATCFAASSKLFEDYSKSLTGDKQKVIDNILTLLKSGSNDYPVEQLKKAGIDLSDSTVIKAVADRLDNLVNLLEIELKNVKMTN